LLLFAGPGAALSHGTAAHHRGWLRYPVKAIHLSTPRRIRMRIRGVVFHHRRRSFDRELINGIPCTTTVQTLLDVPASESDRLIYRCLAQLDYERKLNRRAILDACGRGRPGSAALARALDVYMPQLAHTKSELEDEFLYLCRRADLPLPKVNIEVHGVEPDCYWPELNLVVELDGGGNHGTGPQRTRDQRKALKLRARGIDLVRYTEEQVFLDAGQVTADLRAEIGRRRERTLAA
jgi:very-short-patch-repair endonuclease